MAKGKKKKKKGKKGGAAAEEVPLGTKLQYIGVGMVLGVAAAPTVRKWIERARPEIDKLLERLTAQAEELAENAGDFMATARGRVSAKSHDDTN
ncbi:hypothetical protein LZC95_23185 [Pendulispora brunnea]|uniref:YtxH domain-containing protein n=1 Tax=Pendulispora brunnea TaxID=2905690 RepID=A0ABZ2KM19_9BACT